MRESCKDTGTDGLGDYRVGFRVMPPIQHAEMLKRETSTAAAVGLPLRTFTSPAQRELKQGLFVSPIWSPSLNSTCASWSRLPERLTVHDENCINKLGSHLAYTGAMLWLRS